MLAFLANIIHNNVYSITLFLRKCLFYRIKTTGTYMYHAIQHKEIQCVYLCALYNSRNKHPLFR
jgi:hypothetical protein